MATSSIPYLPVGLTRDNFDAQNAAATVAYAVPDVSATLVTIPIDLVLQDSNKLVLNMEVQCDISGACVFSLATALDATPETVTSNSRTFYASPSAPGPITCVWNTVLVKGVDYVADGGPIVVRLVGAAGEGDPTLTVVTNGNAAEICCSYSLIAIP